MSWESLLSAIPEKKSKPNKLKPAAKKVSWGSVLAQSLSKFASQDNDTETDSASATLSQIPEDSIPSQEADEAKVHSESENQESSPFDPEAYAIPRDDRIPVVAANQKNNNLNRYLIQSANEDFQMRELWDFDRDNRLDFPFPHNPSLSKNQQNQNETTKSSKSRTKKTKIWTDQGCQCDLLVIKKKVTKIPQEKPKKQRREVRVEYRYIDGSKTAAELEIEEVQNEINELNHKIVEVIKRLKIREMISYVERTARTTITRNPVALRSLTRVMEDVDKGAPSLQHSNGISPKPVDTSDQQIQCNLGDASWRRSLVSIIPRQDRGVGTSHQLESGTEWWHNMENEPPAALQSQLSTTAAMSLFGADALGLRPQGINSIDR